MKRCENCEYYVSGRCDHRFGEWPRPKMHKDFVCELFELPEDTRRLERIIREAGKVREYAGALAESVSPGVYLGAVSGIILSGIGGAWEFCIALAALTPDQRAVAARKVLEGK